MADISKLEEQESFADEYGDRIAEWELFAVALVCKELGRIGKMTPEQAKKYNAEKETKKTEKMKWAIDAWNTRTPKNDEVRE